MRSQKLAKFFFQAIFINSSSRIRFEYLCIILHATLVIQYFDHFFNYYLLLFLSVDSIMYIEATLHYKLNSNLAHTTG